MSIYPVAIFKRLNKNSSLGLVHFFEIISEKKKFIFSKNVLKAVTLFPKKQFI
jgi:hypothetical protein